MNFLTTSGTSRLSRRILLLLLSLLVCAPLAIGAGRPQRTVAQDNPPTPVTPLSDNDEAWVVSTAAQLYNDNRNKPDYRSLNEASLQQPLRDCVRFATGNTSLDADLYRNGCQRQVEVTLIFTDPSSKADDVASAAGADLVGVVPDDVVKTFVMQIRQCAAGRFVTSESGANATFNPRLECTYAYPDVDAAWTEGATGIFLQSLPTDQTPPIDKAAVEADFRNCLKSALRTRSKIS